MLVCKFTYLNACTSKLMFVCCCNEREREINVVPMLLHVSERERERERYIRDIECLLLVVVIKGVCV